MGEGFKLVQEGIVPTAPQQLHRPCFTCCRKGLCPRDFIARASFPAKVEPSKDVANQMLGQCHARGPAFLFVPYHGAVNWTRGRQHCQESPLRLSYAWAVWLLPSLALRNKVRPCPFSAPTCR